MDGEIQIENISDEDIDTIHPNNENLEDNENENGVENGVENEYTLTNTNEIYVMDMSNYILQDGEYDECRICFDESSENNMFSAPCLCSGSMKFVHENCINEWRNVNLNNRLFFTCGQCDIRYKFKLKYDVEIGFLTITKYNSFIKFSLPSSCMGLFILYADKPLKMVEFLNSNNLYSNMLKTKEILKEEQAYLFFYYSCFVLYSISVFFTLYFVGSCNFKIYRTTDYFKYMKKSFVNFLVGSSLYLIVLLQDNPGFFINFNVVYYFLMPLLIDKLYKSNYHAINQLNFNNNLTIEHHNVDNGDEHREIIDFLLQSMSSYKINEENGEIVENDIRENFENENRNLQNNQPVEINPLREINI